MKHITYNPKLASNPEGDIKMILMWNPKLPIHYRESVDELESDSVVVVVDDHSTDQEVMDKLNTGDFDNRNITDINYTHIKAYPENLLHASNVFDNKDNVDVILLSNIDK